jgi:hypothetical protein
MSGLQPFCALALTTVIKKIKNRIIWDTYFIAFILKGKCTKAIFKGNKQGNYLFSPRKYSPSFADY